MCIIKLLEFFHLKEKRNTYYGIDKYGEKVFIRSPKLPVIENSRIYEVVSDDEEYIDNLLKERNNGNLLCEE